MTDKRATRSTLKRTSRVVDNLLIEASAHAKSQFKAVEIHARLLGEYMGELHGGSWEVDVDHAAGFILIRPSLKRERAEPVDKSNNGGN